MLRPYQTADKAAVCALWQRAAPQQGYAPCDAARLDELLFCHPYFSARHTFVLEQDGGVHGFICGCTGEDIPHGAERGYFTCILLDDGDQKPAACAALFAALEDSFRLCGKKYSAVTFFNPMRMPWIIPGSPGFEHNNRPGIPVDTPLHAQMLKAGYTEPAREVALYRPLADYAVPGEIERLSRQCAAQGYTVDLYDETRHIGLAEMLLPLENPDWIKSIMDAARDKQMLPVALCGNVVAGFAGPVYPEPTGRGFFAGIGVAPKYQRHGLGKLLFYRLCAYEKQQGAKYMSLFTGENNPAQYIYKGAGFTAASTFGVLLKPL